MATSEIYIDLADTTTWIARDAEGSAISGPYEQKPDNQPKVQWSLNAFAFTGGVKSLTPHLPTGIPTTPGVDSQGFIAPDLLHLIDTTGKEIYLFITNTNEIRTLDPTHWVFRGVWQSLVVRGALGAFLKYSQTVFQTQTLHTFVGGDSFGAGIVVGGDAPSGHSVFSYTYDTNAVEVFNLTGIDLTLERKLGMTSHQNYLLFWDESTIYWSSPIDFQDFTPAIGGGGSTRISEAKGKILVIVPNPQGLIVYCEQNMVHVAFSGDSANPWIFNEIAGSAGVLLSVGNLPLVTNLESGALQIAITSKGIVSVTSNGVQLVDAPLNEMLSNQRIELKPINSVDITAVYPISPATIKLSSKVSKLDLIGDTLFITVGVPRGNDGDNPLIGRLYAFNLATGLTAIFEGTYMGIVQASSFSTSGEALQSVPLNYFGILRDKYLVGDTGTTPIALNLAQGSERVYEDLGLGMRDTEVLLGDIHVVRNKTTIIHSVRLDGRIRGEDLDSEPCKVFVYSKSTIGSTSPVEYIYNGATDTFYGYAEGKDLQLEIRGKNFYLIGANVEVEVGGEF